MTRPTWVRNPQDPGDEHDWAQWFDDPRKYRGMTFDWKEEQWLPQRTTPST